MATVKLPVSRPSTRAVGVVLRPDKAINPDLERFYAKGMGAKTGEVNASHLGFVSHPDAVTRLIEQAASAAAK